MTIFAVMCAGHLPADPHGAPLGRAFSIFPYPNQHGPCGSTSARRCVWDVFAISTYFTISLVFWYLGMIPDLATLRDRAAGGLKKRRLPASLAWAGAVRTAPGRTTRSVYLVLAALSTPLVLSVHSIVCFDFATSLVPGWHTTIFPPYFVAGAIFSGFAHGADAADHRAPDDAPRGATSPSTTSRRWRRSRC